MNRTNLIQWFETIGLGDTATVGGKNASLGEMYRELSPHGIKIPNGFAVTAEAYWLFLKSADLLPVIAERLRSLDVRDERQLAEAGRAIRERILDASLPAELQEAIVEAYNALSRETGGPADVAVRSSATAEDLPGASFAGQQETYLNVRGAGPLLDACKRCFASLFTNRAISYRSEKGFDHLKVALSIGVQRMVRSDLACAGVMFSLDTETGFPDVVLINASYGLGEYIVQGVVTPDEYYVFKPTLRTGSEPILRRNLGSKEIKLVYDEGGGKMVRSEPVPREDRDRFALTDTELLRLARWACLIEDYYSTKIGRPTPMDIEWAKDGKSGEIFIVQARPETVQSHRHPGRYRTYHLEERGNALLTGHSVGEAIAHGPVRIIRNVSLLPGVQQGDILVTERTDPDWEPYLKKVAAVVTNQGGRTCHAAIISRELGIPAVVGTERGTALLRDGQPVTVSCAEGDTGKVYQGHLKYAIREVSLAEIPRTRTKIMLNVGNPDQAFHLAALPNDGVGLARIEFIITRSVRIHPLALLNYSKDTPPAIRREIESITAGYADKSQFFVDKLAEGIGMIGAAFYPKEVIVRFSDFKTNEYAHLIGGEDYEPKEENPMLGFRGASRYHHPRYQAAFALECRALRKVRETMGLDNVKAMVPFCRTVEEGRLVLEEMRKSGLERGKRGFQVYVMCEIPSNVLLAEEFAQIFDGFSIGSNDLTQLVLGVDRDSSLVAPLFDERNPAVKAMIRSAIQAAKKHGCKIGICGQAPSDYPEFAEFLVREGIDSLSLNPDTAIKTSLAVARVEAELSLIP
jgi:pyruvate,water dikinase